MDRHKASWILEFVLRQPIDDWLAKEILLRLPSPPLLDPHLKKTLLLRRLSSDLSAHRLSQLTLLSLELLDELDRSLGPPADPHNAAALKAVYCAVAAELTAAPLRRAVRRRAKAKAEAEAEFLETADRIWNRRVADLEKSDARGLVGEGLREWRRVVGDAVAGGAAARGRLRRRDTRREAEVALGEYLRVALEDMGPPLLELLAEAVASETGGGGGGDVRVESRVAAERPGVATQPSVPTTGGIHPATQVEETPETSEMAGQTRSHNKDRIFEPHRILPIPEANERNKALGAVSVDLPKVVGDPPSKATVRTAEIQDRISEAPANPDYSGPDRNQAGVCVAGPSVEENPQAVASEGTIGEDQRGGEHVEMIQNRMVEASADPRGSGHNKKQVDINMAQPSIEKDAQATSTHGTAVEDHQGGEHARRPPISLMERNPTARTRQWDEDSSETLSEKSADSSKRPHLPTPRVRRVSPLKLYKDTKFARRRKNKRWTPQEEDVLREAVKRHGVGNWKFILQFHPGSFEDRTEVDLKDKWRNMSRYNL